MAIPEWITNEFAPAFCRMLLHSLWIGVLVALLAFIIIATTKKTPASVRYNWLVLLFVVFTVASIAIFFQELKTVGLVTVNPVAGNSTVSNNGSLSNGPPAMEHYSGPGIFSDILVFLDKNAIAIVSFWLAVFFFKMIKIGLGLRHIHLIKKRHVHEVDEEWTLWLKQKAIELGIQKTIRFLQSELIKVPMVLGHLKPLVLIPLGLLSHLSPQQVESILIHELAHVKRSDYVVNLVQSFMEAVFFFNPSILWLSSLIRQEREKCCDDIAVQHSNRKDYLEALMSFQIVHDKNNYAMALQTQKNSLLERVKRIVSRENNPLSRGELYLLIIAVMVTAFSFMAFRTKPKNLPVLPVKKEVRIDKKTNPQLQLVKTKKIKNTGVMPARKQKTFVHTPKVETELLTPSNHIPSFNSTDSVPKSSYNSQVGILKDGQAYIIKRNGDEIIYLNVDGKEIPKEDYSKYNALFEEIEKKRNHMDSTKKLMEVKRKEMEVRRKEMDIKRKEIEGKHAAMRAEFLKKQEHFDILRKESKEKQEAMLAQHAKERMKFEEMKKRSDSLRKSFKAAPPYSKYGMMNAQGFAINNIIADLTANNIIESDNPLSFSLTYDKFIVNGKKQSQAVLEKFREKYVKQKGNYFDYSNKEGKIKTEIYTE